MKLNMFRTVPQQTCITYTRNCSKHVEFHSNNKFDKFVHLVGFIIRNARVGFKSTAKSLQGLQDPKKSSFTNFIWALSDMEAVSKNMLGTLALNVTCTAKT